MKNIKQLMPNLEVDETNIDLVTQLVLFGTFSST